MCGMHSVAGIINNPVLIVTLICYGLAQLLKVPVHFLLEKEWDWHQIRAAGGMPSSHTALVVSVTLMIGVTQGFDTALFALSAAIACIVMYDATGVRYETGKQAVIINQILHNVLVNGKPISDAELKEVVGHKPIEVFVGGLLALVVVLVYVIFAQ